MKDILVKDVDILKQSSKNVSIALEIKNKNMKVVDKIEGLLISDSYTIDATSDVRRTYNFEMEINHSKYLMNDTTNLFMNRLISAYIGIRYDRTNEIIWYKYGTYCIVDKNYSYDSTSHTLNVSCEDMMCLLNGKLNGILTDQTLEIKAGENIRNIIISLLNEANITKYIIQDLDIITPYDLQFSGTNYYDIIKQILDLYSGYEMYFDVDGVFILRQIPTNDGDNIILDDDIMQPLIISDNGTSTYKEIYNHIKVYGLQIEAQRTSNSCTYTNGVYNASFDILTSYENFITYAITLPITNDIENCKININNIGEKNITINDNIGVPISYFEPTTYTFRYRKLTDDFLLLGKYQVFGEAYDDNKDSPFNKDNLGYEVCNVIIDDKIYTDNLATQRANYEIYKSTNMKNDIDLDMVFIPWLDVNYKVSYTSKNIGMTQIYVIQSISGNTTDGTMSVSMIKYYPDII